jgi:hypothetical protein
MHVGFSRLAFALAAIALAALPSSARADNGVTPVIVQNPVTLNPATPNPVTLNPAAPNQVTLGNPDDVAKAAVGLHHPFEFAARQAWSGNVCLVTAKVPAKQRAVIEYITASGNIPATTTAPGLAFNTHTDLTLASAETNPFEDSALEPAALHPLNVPPGLDLGNGDKNYQASQSVRAYADPGTPIDILFSIPLREPTPNEFCFFTITGQLIDVP